MPDTPPRVVNDPDWQQQYQPQRRTAPVKSNAPSNAPSWVQALSVAVIALLMVIMFAFMGVQYLKVKMAFNNYQQQQSQNCGVNPSTGLIECR